MRLHQFGAPTQTASNRAFDKVGFCVYASQSGAFATGVYFNTHFD
jgi:hypothetical protein